LNGPWLARKKNSAEHSTSNDLDGHALAQRYEVLRRNVVEPGAAACRQDVHGLAVLVRKGMAAWMRCVAVPGAGSPTTSSDSATTTSCTEAWTSGIEQTLINIVAAMTLVRTKEVFA
jgi:hypothetical protein